MLDFNPNYATFLSMWKDLVKTLGISALCGCLSASFLSNDNLIFRLKTVQTKRVVGSNRSITQEVSTFSHEKIEGKESKDKEIDDDLTAHRSDINFAIVSLLFDSRFRHISQRTFILQESYLSLPPPYISSLSSYPVV
ncbi:MAG: hypothetical protein O9264_02995 [Leptospira sp.]|nr:hypothetical protein [Leptospira sp.]